jgi:hypothetical protein
VSGEFIGDYQGIAADDVVAIPFWNSTQDNSLPASNPEHSPYQEVYAARIPNTKVLGGPAGGPTGGSRCIDRKKPISTVTRRALKRRKGRVLLSGKSRDVGCAAKAARTPRDRGGIKRVFVSIGKVVGKKCRFLTRKGKLLRAKRSCSRPVLLPAKGRTKWRFSIRARLPRGKYRAVVRAVDQAGNKEGPRKRNTIAFTVR